jgi:hypothetical protein
MKTKSVQDGPDFEMEFYRNLLQTKYSVGQIRQHLISNGAFPEAVSALNRDQMIALVLNPEDRFNKRYFRWGRGGFGMNMYGMEGDDTRAFERMGHLGAGEDGMPMFGIHGFMGSGGGGAGGDICSGLDTYAIKNDPEVLEAIFRQYVKMLKYKLVKAKDAAMRRRKELTPGSGPEYLDKLEKMLAEGKPIPRGPFAYYSHPISQLDEAEILANPYFRDAITAYKPMFK